MPALRLIGFGTVASGLDLPEADLGPVVRILERQRADGWHQAAQCYVSLGGVPVLDVGVGEARPGRAVRPDDLMLWYSSGKPLTTVAVLRCGSRDVSASTTSSPTTSTAGGTARSGAPSGTC